MFLTVTVLESYRKKAAKKKILSIHIFSLKSCSVYFSYTVLHALRAQGDKIILCSCQYGFPPYKTYVTPRPQLFKPYYEREIAQMNKATIFKSSLI